MSILDAIFSFKKDGVTFTGKPIEQGFTPNFQDLALSYGNWSGSHYSGGQLMSGHIGMTA